MGLFQQIGALPLLSCLLAFHLVASAQSQESATESLDYDDDLNAFFPTTTLAPTPASAPVEGSAEGSGCEGSGEGPLTPIGMYCMQ